MSEAERANCADIVVFGGGVAGLWLASLLKNQGFSVLLLSRGKLGLGQTLWSQGIIHGGAKYVLQGKSSPVFDTIPAMPQRWREHLAGAAQPDLSPVPTLLDTYYLLSNSRPWSRMRSFLGSKMLHGKVAKVPRREHPQTFGRIRGGLYTISDLVLDIPALVAHLAQGLAEVAYSTDGVDVQLQRGTDGWLVQLGEQRVQAGALVLAAGEGNEALAQQVGMDSVPMQRRIFRQITVHSESLPQIYVHCIGGGFSTSPDLTITTHSGGPRGRWWSLGGRAATGYGDDVDDAAQIAGTQEALQRFFPHIRVDDADWQVQRVAVAEPEYGGIMPDHPFCEYSERALLCWPIKLTFAPLLGDMVLDALRDNAVQAQAPSPPVLSLPRAVAAASPWEAHSA